MGYRVSGFGCWVEGGGPACARKLERRCTTTAKCFTCREREKCQPFVNLRMARAAPAHTNSVTWQLDVKT